MKPDPTQRLIWASRRELLNVFHAESSGCQVFAVTNDIPKKPRFVDKDFLAYCLDTVKMFHEDAKAAGFAL
jgi:transaldolase